MLDWRIVKETFEAGKSLVEVCDSLTDERVVETLGLISEVNAEAAARLLAEARDRDGEARTRKIEASLPLLEAAYVAQAKKVRKRWRMSLYSYRHPIGFADDLSTTCDLAVLAAAAYHALGDDPVSVRSRLLEAQSACERLISQLERLVFLWAVYQVASVTNAGANGKKVIARHQDLDDRLRKRVDLARSLDKDLKALTHGLPTA